MADKTDQSFGVVPVWVAPDGSLRFLLVRHLAGHWAFPKGHPEDGETPVESARRECLEETGVRLKVLREAPAFEERYRFRSRKGKVIDKTVTYYVGLAESDAATPQEEEISELAWGDEAATWEKLSFEEGRALFEEVCEHLAAEPLA